LSFSVRVEALEARAFFSSVLALTRVFEWIDLVGTLFKNL
jgi:hypothetical protein